ncbi:uncharacterized protein BO95DRAFT_193932 [Aspergillus brunneoviolaceus CBS 621.78]|uniref:Uncharacterized protein n=1 Tax=Aspergillus brunneoviolaceus CBS 621.78 TaxID=1450534 RepID=A0ACD1GLQ4_9EURO|nr:hypothetical protein BO95DRAFT_193932 [Aspergillus brunneoviolaceus CBS 621.78]RAH50196.1 hypothetical protein BO95DRAFT_193932 [Aspergillus brunneoviolaceus CBS 621.78]
MNPKREKEGLAETRPPARARRVVGPWRCATGKPIITSLLLLTYFSRSTALLCPLLTRSQLSPINILPLLDNGVFDLLEFVLPLTCKRLLLLLLSLPLLSHHLSI